ncbi:serine hydrolase [Nostocoides sp. F2B08]|uniref:serine hydrolase domain-containing protein n=1 Tax=Nostocoides sp. F2B08 TaxID=2653936 RepID=UPI001263E062|nr:serine hydrolase domain-containing protein [Tetrasphaera sp. F2B08]KAB7746234.1 serine hydrolase [Tetrasphaera sp. F2B08]
MKTWTRATIGLSLAFIVTACTGAGTDPEPTASMTTEPSPTVSELPTALPWPVAPASALPDENTTPMITEMQRWVDGGFLPGATAAVVSPRGEWTGAVGVDGQGATLEPTSGMALAQITQTFVAAEALLLAEQGKLDLDVPASTYLPIPQLANGATTRHLLGHRAAIPDPGPEPYASVFTAPDAHWSAEQFLEPVPEATDPPGEEFYEDTTNYVLAGLVVQEAAGRSTGAALAEDLWSPLGLERFAYQDEQSLPEPIAAPGEDENVPEGQTGRPYLPFRSAASAEAAAKGVAGDALSVARWGYELYGGHVLTPESVAQLTDFVDVEPRYGLATVDFSQPFFYRWGLDGYGIWGGTVGYRSVLAIYPDNQLSVAILTPSTVDAIPYVRHLVNAGGLRD